MCVEPGKNKRLLKKAAKKFLKLRLHEGFAECSGMSWPRRARKGLPDSSIKEVTCMKVLFMVLLAVFLLVGNLMAQAAPQPAQQSGFAFSFKLGVDNILWYEKGQTPKYVFGGGLDVATYEHKFINGVDLLLNLHGTYSTIGIVSAGITVDVVKLLGGTNIKLPFKDVTCLVGGTGGVNTSSGNFGGGPIAFINYKF